MSVLTSPELCHQVQKSVPQWVLLVVDIWHESDLGFRIAPMADSLTARVHTSRFNIIGINSM